MNTDDAAAPPPRGDVALRETRIQILRQAQFRAGASALDRDARALIAEVAAALRAHPEIERVAVVGHASLEERAPVRLSTARARAVLAALVALGIEPPRLVAHGAGSTQPIAANATATGRAHNRRVEFSVMVVSGREVGRWTAGALASPPSTEVPMPVRP